MVHAFFDQDITWNLKRSTYKISSFVNQLPYNSVPFSGLGIDDSVQIIRNGVQPEPEPDDIGNGLIDRKMFVMEIQMAVYFNLLYYSFFCDLTFYTELISRLWAVSMHAQGLLLKKYIGHNTIIHILVTFVKFEKVLIYFFHYWYSYIQLLKWYTV